MSDILSILFYPLLIFVYCIRIENNPLTNVHVNTPPNLRSYKGRNIFHVCVLIFIRYKLFSCMVFSRYQGCRKFDVINAFPRVWLVGNSKNK